MNYSIQRLEELRVDLESNVKHHSGDEYAFADIDIIGGDIFVSAHVNVNGDMAAIERQIPYVLWCNAAHDVVMESVDKVQHDILMLLDGVSSAGK